MINIKKIVKFISVSCIAFGLIFVGANLFPKNEKLLDLTEFNNSPEQPIRSEFCRVIRIIDGDTIVVNNGSKNEKVRFIGINTPETVDPKSPIERYGKEASAFTRRMLEGKKVRLEYDIQQRDKYLRLLAYVYLENGQMFNRMLVEEGYAQAMTVPPNIKYQQDFIRLERKARENNKGLWNSPPAPLLK